MSKKEILEEMQRRLNVSKEKAEKLFYEARNRGEIRVTVNWKKIMDCLIVLMLVISGSYALLKILF